MNPDPTPSPSPSVTSDASPSPVPTVTVTTTATVQAGPSVVTLDPPQYTGLTVGVVLVLLFVVATFAAQLRRP